MVNEVKLEIKTKTAYTSGERRERETGETGEWMQCCHDKGRRGVYYGIFGQGLFEMYVLATLYSNNVKISTSCIRLALMSF